VITKVERYHVPNYLRARCIFFKKFLEDKKNDGEDLNHESFYMGLTLDVFIAWKAEEMTMNTSLPHVARSRDLVADFKKGIKRDPSLFPSLKHEDNWDPTSLDSVISDNPNWYEAEPSPPLPDPMYDEYGEFRGRVLINQHEWQVHYFGALDAKTGPDNDDEFHDALEQFADDPDSVIDLVVYRANRARYVYDHETVEAAPKFVMTSEPDYGQLRPRLGWLPVDAIKKTFEHTTQLARMPMSTILKK
jgi:hypothetical protein